MSENTMPELPAFPWGDDLHEDEIEAIHAYARAYAEQEVAKERADIIDWCEAFSAQVDDLDKVAAYIRSKS